MTTTTTKLAAALLFLVGGLSHVQAETIPLPTHKPFKTPAYNPAHHASTLPLHEPAKLHFGKKKNPAALPPQAVGGYAKGCLAGGEALPKDGESWQVMRLSRNRNWGHPELVDFLEALANDAPALGWQGLLVGDMAQPRGGPMLTGHASHQIGLDADIWLTPMPDRRFTRKERESTSAISMLKGNMELPGADRSVDPKKWSDSHSRLIRRAAQDERVARIFVSPAIKKALCEYETEDRDWLRRVRPWWGHHYHFHVRLKCPSDSASCVNQPAPPRGDGCGDELTWWLSDEPWVPVKPKPGEKPKEVKKKPPLTLDDLPDVCQTILLADGK
ncbi:penicillin-insensitive murein endopeptidase [Rhodobacteraceae bacterium RKSG542]|uniref:penicillin-insensitive murein endopeptidase n=1 Tax=Pseudovibrio flavus TaxID=2529854 RepID=UPI0012BD3D5A|nr:penicillin-insensitive murein endopeptidase [Pseudovibrio flavus]MTI17243.1 penicillin-insensitive murein endopeptidase [Pseudovibrio flavus]